MDAKKWTGQNGELSKAKRTDDTSTMPTSSWSAKKLMNYSNNHILIKLFLAALATILLAGGPLAADIIDQSQLVHDGGTPVYDEAWLAQTFTPSAVGEQLDHVDLLIDDYNPKLEITLVPTQPATISIVETGIDGGPLNTVNPIENPLASVYMPGGFVVGWNSIDFLPFSLSLTAETLYAIVIQTDDPWWWDSPTDAFRVHWGLDDEPEPTDFYDRGVLWEWLPSTGWEPARYNSEYEPGIADLAFRTYMTPEPLTLALLGLGMLPVLLKRPKHKTTT